MSAEGPVRRDSAAGEEEEEDAGVLFETDPLYVDGVVMADGVDHRGGKRAVFADRDIKAGSLVLAENPVLTWPEDSGDYNLDIATVRSILAKPQAERELLLRELGGLHPVRLADVEDQAAVVETRKANKKEIEQIMKEFTGNTRISAEEILRLLFVLRFNGFASGVYLHLSIINHACKPNCIKHQPGYGTASEIRATQDIKAGEEILICYLVPMEQMRATRRRELKKQYLFDCDCTLCTTVVPFIESFKCLSAECTGEVVVQTGVCSGCNTTTDPDILAVKAADIEASLSALEVEAELFKAGRGRFRFDQLGALRAKALELLHPRHLILARMYKLISDVYGQLISGPCENFDENVLNFLEGSLELRKTQTLYLGKDHIDIAATLSDISQAIRTLLSCNPKMLMNKYPEWSPESKAVEWEAKFNAAFHRIEALYNDDEQ